MKIDYEEAIRCLAVILDEDECYRDAEDVEDRATMLDLAINRIETFIEQYKPPTWEEVVNAWKDIDYEVSRDYEEEKEITSVMQIGSGELKHFSFIFKYSAVAFGQNVYNLTTEELSAINLTIRYSESQKA